METISLVPMAREPAGLELAYAMKRDALGPHVIPRWGWDEAAQRATMQEKFRAKTFHRIVAGEETVGVIAIDDEEDGAIEIGEFYIAPRFQRRGIGGRVLEAVLAGARAQSRAVRLQCIKWNPACGLYRRHGFAVVAETENHYLMERPPN